MVRHGWNVKGCQLQIFPSSESVDDGMMMGSCSDDGAKMLRELIAESEWNSGMVNGMSLKKVDQIKDCTTNYITTSYWDILGI